VFSKVEASEISTKNRACNPLKTFHTAPYRADNLPFNSQRVTLAKLNYHNLLGQLGCSMVKLTDLGFQKGAVAETIVSAYNSDGSPNAAPMGVTIKNQQLTIDLYNSSTTLANIKSSRCAVVNLTSNIEVYYKTAFKEANSDGALPQEWFTKAQAVNAPKLRFAEASVEVSVADLTAVGAEKTRAVLDVELLKAEKLYPQVYCRAFGLTLEAIIHATRVKALTNDQKEQVHVDELVGKIRDCNVSVCRVAPNSPYSAVMADLMKRVETWSQK
jgi:uncharacterized protein